MGPDTSLRPEHGPGLTDDSDSSVGVMKLWSGLARRMGHIRRRLTRRAAPLEVVSMLDDKDIDESVMLKGTYFLKGLEELQRRYPIIGNLDRRGLALRMDICCEDGRTPDKPMADRMLAEGLKDVVDSEGGNCSLALDIVGDHGNVVTLSAEPAMSYDEIGQALRLLDRLLHRLTKR